MTTETKIVTLALAVNQTPNGRQDIYCGPFRIGAMRCGPYGQWIAWRFGNPLAELHAVFDTHEEARAALEAAVLETEVDTFQKRVDAWIQACFGPEIGADKTERNHRFIEEALELVQAGGCTVSEAHQLVDYVFNRPVGELNQEVGGVMNTLASLCNVHGIDLDAAAETELARVWTKVEKIRAKSVTKPKHSPLPGRTPSDAPA